MNSTNGLQFVSGSHHWKEWFYPKNLPDNYQRDPLWVKDRKFQQIPDIESEVQEGKQDIISFNVEVRTE